MLDTVDIFVVIMNPAHNDWFRAPLVSSYLPSRRSKAERKLWFVSGGCFSDVDMINYKNMIKASAYICIVLGLVLLTPIANAKNLHFEKFYQERWCKANGGETEVVFPDKTRCDCLTSTHAIEFDFGKKWAEAIGQALYYSIQTGKRPGVVLILEKKSDYKYWIRLNTIIEHFRLPIDTWKVGP